MKIRGVILVLGLLLGPLVARAQSDPNTGTVGPGAAPPEVIITQRSQSENQPPPAGPMERKQQVEVHVVTPGPLGEGPMAGAKLGPGLGAWWKNSEVVSKLQLTDEQVRKISQTFLDHRLKLIDLQADLDKQELRLEPLLDVDHPDEGKVGTQIDSITTARGRLEKENAMMMLDIRRWLSVEQWKKLKSLQFTAESERNVMYFRSGPGGNMGGPPPPPLPGDMPATQNH